MGGSAGLKASGTITDRSRGTGDGITADGGLSQAPSSLTKSVDLKPISHIPKGTLSPEPSLVRLRAPPRFILSIKPSLSTARRVLISAKGGWSSKILCRSHSKRPLQPCVPGVGTTATETWQDENDISKEKCNAKLGNQEGNL